MCYYLSVFYLSSSENVHRILDKEKRNGGDHACMPAPPLTGKSSDGAPSIHPSDPSHPPILCSNHLKHLFHSRLVLLLLLSLLSVRPSFSFSILYFFPYPFSFLLPLIIVSSLPLSLFLLILPSSLSFLHSPPSLIPPLCFSLLSPFSPQLLPPYSFCFPCYLTVPPALAVSLPSRPPSFIPSFSASMCLSSFLLPLCPYPAFSLPLSLSTASLTTSFSAPSLPPSLIPTLSLSSIRSLVSFLSHPVLSSSFSPASLPPSFPPPSRQGTTIHSSSCHLHSRWRARQSMCVAEIAFPGGCLCTEKPSACAAVFAGYVYTREPRHVWCWCSVESWLLFFEHLYRHQKAKEKGRVNNPQRN